MNSLGVNPSVNPSEALLNHLKADLDDTIFAYDDYRARLACVMTSRLIVSSKLDQRHSCDTAVDVVSENCARVGGPKS